MKNKEKIEFGDWQTPINLAIDICIFVSELIKPNIIIDPNCGIGTFLNASLVCFPNSKKIIGIDTNKEYTNIVLNNKCSIIHDNFFKLDWSKYITKENEPILIIGNPPWINNTNLSKINSSNVPNKYNIHLFKGYDAVTGKSNFDISEYMIIKEIESLIGKDAVLAMLCKTSVARKVMTFLWKNKIIFSDSQMRIIDAKKYFNVNVSACLFIVIFDKERKSLNQLCNVFDSIKSNSKLYTLGIENNILTNNIDVIDKYRSFVSNNELKWRSGIKHDCCKIMELIENDGKYINGLEEIVDIENDLVYPMLKSSDLGNGRIDNIKKFMIVTQKYIGQDTKKFYVLYPKTYKYLNYHIEYFNRRKSSIYKNKPMFSIFGVGNYTFTDWKIAVSSLYKKIKFNIIGPYENKPVVFDDSCYFLPCESENEAKKTLNVLQSEIYNEILNSLIFLDSKRPITAEILNKINIMKIMEKTI